MKKILTIIVALALVFSVLPAGSAVAKYPEKPITLIVAYGAGGGTDVTARLLAKGMEKVIGQPVVVQNISGGGGWAGWQQLAFAAPDGYTIGYLNVPNIFAGYLDPKMKRKENLESFTALMNHVTDPCLWVVKSDSPYKSLKDLVEAAKKEPGKISIAAHGYGNDDHLAILEMEKMTGSKFNVIHNQTTAISRSQLLGGHIAAVGANVSEVFQDHIKGEMRVLGVMREARSPFLPDVPTFKEQGYHAIWSVSRGIGAPAGLPAEIEKALIDVLGKAVQSQEHREKSKQLGLSLDLMTGRPYAESLKKNEQQIKQLMGW